MNRAPTWLPLSGIGVVLTALCLCDWIMGWKANLPDEPVSAAVPEAPQPIFEAPPAPAMPPRSVAAGVPAFVAPPGAIPPFILEVAERTTQLARGFTRGAWIVFGLYPDGLIRFVDLDGGTYEGNSSSARATMSEIGGSRSFALAIGVAADGRLQASFSGGIHDGQTIVLETVAENPVA